MKFIRGPVTVNGTTFASLVFANSRIEDETRILELWGFQSSNLEGGRTRLRFDIPSEAVDPTDYVIQGYAWLVANHQAFSEATVEDHVVDPLQELKASFWLEMKRRRKKIEEGGCETPFGRIDTDLNSQLKLTGAASAAQIALGQQVEFAIEWTLEDNSSVQLDAQQLIAMALIVMNHVNECHSKGRLVRQQIEAASTTEQVTNIIWPE